MSNNDSPPPNRGPEFSRRMIEDFRAHGGVVTIGQYAGRNVLLLLTTTGAKTGQPRVNPLTYSRDGDRYVVVASKGGMPTSPDWYHNLVANPIVTVEVGRERFRARAVVQEGAERDRLYAAHAALLPVFVEYQSKTTRRIPVVVLERIE